MWMLCEIYFRREDLAVSARPALGNYFLFLAVLLKSGFDVVGLYSIVFYICFCFRDVFLSSTEDAK